jgi:hypothetical protein
VEKCGRNIQAKDDDVISRQRFAYWVTKARIHTLIILNNLFLFHDENVYANATPRALPVLLLRIFFSIPSLKMVLL